MAFKKTVLSLIAIGTFIMAMFFFIYGYLDVNNPDAELIKSHNYTFRNYSVQLNNTLSEFKSLSDDAVSAADSSSPTAEFIFLIAEAFWSIPKMFVLTMVSTIGLVISSAFGTSVVFGQGFAIVIILISAVMTIVMVFSLIKFIRTGADT